LSSRFAATLAIDFPAPARDDLERAGDSLNISEIMRPVSRVAAYLLWVAEPLKAHQRFCGSAAHGYRVRRELSWQLRRARHGIGLEPMSPASSIFPMQALMPSKTF
jgi:hypothetical protein